jgi:hypothetical protein
MIDCYSRLFGGAAQAQQQDHALQLKTFVQPSLRGI